MFQPQNRSSNCKNSRYKTANSLSSEITVKERNSNTNLTITGTIESLNFVTLCDSFPVLEIMNLKGASKSGDAISHNAFYSNKGWR